MRETLRSVTLAGLAVLAVALAAATLDSTVAPEGPDQSGPGGFGGEGGGGLMPVPRTGPPLADAVQIPFLSEILAILATVLAVLVIAYAVRNLRRTFAAVLAAVVLLGLSFVLFQFLPPLASPPGRSLPIPGDGRLFGGAAGGGGRPDTIQPATPPAILLVVLVLALVGTVIVFRRTTTDEADEAAAAEPAERSTEAVAVGRAAGRAADRIEREPDVENEVYRAWREMTGLLDVEHPETSTPGEFADAAVAAGLGRADVGELTRLFEDVRYGETRPSEEHERRAVAVFRRIEDRYAEDDA